MDRVHHAAGLKMQESFSSMLLIAALSFCFTAPSRATDQDGGVAPPFKPYVDMKTFMEHVLTPAAKVVWRVNGILIDARGEHDLAPRSDADWEEIVSGSATLAEAANALMIPQRALDKDWNFYSLKLAAAAEQAYQAAEAHDLKAISDVSDRLDGICSACHRHYGLE
jgi:hypothetical protein